MSGKGMLWCEAHNTDCLYMDHGACKAVRCNVEDPDYIAKEHEKELRRQQLYEAGMKDKHEEKEAQKLIRTQNKTKADILAKEITFTKSRMERFYTKGWTKLGDRESDRLAELQRELEKVK